MPLSADDRDSVRSNLESMGPHGALLWAGRRLGAESGTLRPSVRRMLVLTVHAAARQLRADVQAYSRLARCHAQGMRQQAAAVEAAVKANRQKKGVRR